MRYIAIFILLVLYNPVFSQEKKPLKSQIEKVTLYLEGAQVERVYKGVVGTGRMVLSFDNVSPHIDKQSIQVQADPSLVVYSVLHQINFMTEQEKREEITLLEDKKMVLEERLAMERNMLAVLGQEEILLSKNQDIGGSNGIKVVDLKDAADFQRARLTEIFQKKQETNQRIGKIEVEMGKLIRQLNELNQKKDQFTSEIQVSVDSKSASPVTIMIRYLVQKAGWSPSYDVRVKDITQPVDLQYKANVFQQSGEDWKNVKLFLSTGNPNDKGNKPELKPWYLRYNAIPVRPIAQQGYNSFEYISGRLVDEKGQPLLGASVIVKGTSQGVVTDNQGNFRLQAPQAQNTLVASMVGYELVEFNAAKGAVVNVSLVPSTRFLEEVVVVGYSSSRSAGESNDYRESPTNKKKQQVNAISTVTTYQPTTVVYEIKEPYSIPNDGKTYAVEIDAYELNASYEYFAAPKLEPDVYLTANIVDWQELNLQPGEVNLFFENNYLGQSFLDVLNANDTLKLSLGKDKGVVVKRTLLKEFSTRKFLGSNKTDTRLYEITVRNNKNQPISITIEDQLPVSTDKEIEIRDKKYEGAKLEEETQKLSWQFTLDPKKENKLKVGYEVRYPKEKVLYLD